MYCIVALHALHNVAIFVRIRHDGPQLPTKLTGQQLHSLTTPHVQGN